MDVAVMPVKRLSYAKGRLASHFEAPERLELARALFEDTLELAERASFLTWLVVSDDATVLTLAADKHLGVLEDRGGGLNAALAQAARHLEAREADSMTVVPADLPLAAPEDLLDVIETAHDADVVIVPSGRDGGTNALALRPPGLLEPSFGRDSFAAHFERAQRLSARCVVLPLPRMSLDIDTIEDVEDLLGRAASPPTRTLGALRRWKQGRAARPG
jgi:2-phospho-L-lactate/phosphoenolpyruvate guanylyltransferase